VAKQVGDCGVEEEARGQGAGSREGRGSRGGKKSDLYQFNYFVKWYDHPET